MIIYNVTVKVATDVHLQWLKWMREEHIPATIATGLFNEYRMSRLLEQDDQEGPTYAIQFFAESLHHYNTFRDTHQQALRQRGYEVFGNQFIAFITIMEVI